VSLAGFACAWHYRQQLSRPPTIPVLPQVYPAFLPPNQTLDPRNGKPISISPSFVWQLTSPLPQELTAGPTREKAIDSLRNATNIRINVDWTSLKQGGLEPSTPISVVVGGKTLGAALDSLVFNLGFSKGLYVTSANDAILICHSSTINTVQARQYDVSDILSDPSLPAVVWPETLFRMSKPEIGAWATKTAGMPPESYNPLAIVGTQPGFSWTVPPRPPAPVVMPGNQSLRVLPPTAALPRPGGQSVVLTAILPRTAQASFAYELERLQWRARHARIAVAASRTWNCTVWPTRTCSVIAMPPVSLSTPSTLRMRKSPRWKAS
jgi:hypothetical protein